MDQLTAALVGNLKQYLESNRKSKAVVGVSGGVDSAVTATIAVRAIGKENVLALRMPHKDFSSEENLRDAREVCEMLGIESREVDISVFADPIFELDFATKKMTRGNIMARVRMVLLYALANENDAIVLGTGNKTEMLTGFFTKYGDGGVDVEVLGNLWKTEVFELAKHLGLPKNVYTKAPSAELYLGHTDEGELGMTYSELDTILQTMEADPNFMPGTDKEQKVVDILAKTEHKRAIVKSIGRN